MIYHHLNSWTIISQKMLVHCLQQYTGGSCSLGKVSGHTTIQNTNKMNNSKQSHTHKVQRRPRRVPLISIVQTFSISKGKAMR